MTETPHRLAIALFLAVALLPAIAAASGAAPAAPPGAAAVGAQPPPATLRFFNRDIITFRAAYLGFLPAERAAGAADRIAKALAKQGPGTVAMARVPEGLSVSIDGLFVFRVLEGDLDADDGQTFDEARVVVGRRLDEAVAAARQSLRGKAFLQILGLALGATVVLGAAAWLTVAVRRSIRRRVDAHLASRTNLGESERLSILRVIRALGHIVFVLVLAGLLEEWLRFVLALFPYTRPWADHLTGYAGSVFAQVGSAILHALPGLVMVAIIATLAALVVKIVRALARGIEAGRYEIFGIDADVVTPARRLVNAAIWLFALAMAYPYLPGSDSDAFKGLSVLVGLMLSLGASGIVGQAAGGFILTFSHALRPAEWVRIGETEGVVMSVGIFATKIRTPLDEEVSIPNTVVLGTIVKNFSRPARGKAAVLETSVTIGYNAPWRQVHAMLQEAAMRTPELLRDPAPTVLQTALSDFYVQYSLRARLADPLRRPAVLSALNANIQDVFNEHGVQIMSPHYKADPHAPVVVPRERWFDPPAAPPGGGTADRAARP